MSSGSHLSKELFDLVKSIGESRSKQEEDKIILQELGTLKSKISEPSIPPKKMKEMLMRAIYIEMLGHDASFAYIHAINLTNCGSIVAKRVGYVTCALCLPSESPLLILLVSNLQKDLQSANYLEVSSALTAVCKLVNEGFVHAFSEQILRLTSHSHELIRKKAVIVLNRFMKLNPNLASEYSDVFRKTLCDKDPSVMGASLNSLGQMLEDPNNVPRFKDLVTSLVVILRQIMDQRLPKDFDYHRISAPWLQMKLLEIFGRLGEGDKRSSEIIYGVVEDVMRRSDEIGGNIGHAIVYHALLTVTRMYPNPHLLEKSAAYVSKFLTSDNNNLKYTGITGLICIVKINPNFSLRHQEVVVDCLEDPDDTIKRKTLNLLYKMTNTANIKVIIEKLNKELSSALYDSHLKQEIVAKICELAEKFAPDSKWYLKTMNEMLEIAGDFIKPSVINNLVKLIDEWRDDPLIIQYTVNEYFQILSRIEVLPDCIMQISAWVMGEFGFVLGPDHFETLVLLLCRCLFKRFEDPLTKGWILTALQKLNRGEPSEQTRDFISRFSTSRNEDLQQRCYEFAGASTKIDSVLNYKNNLKLETQFDFLDKYVQQARIRGAKDYDTNKDRRGIGYLITKTRNDEYKASEAIQSMRLEAYTAPNPEKIFEKNMAGREERIEQVQHNAKVWTKHALENEIKPSTQGKFVVKPKPEVWAKVEKSNEREELMQGIFGGIAKQDSFKTSQTKNNQNKNNQVKKFEPENLLDL